MLTVIDILMILNKGENYLIKVNDYNRINNVVVDEFNLFEKREIPVPTPFKMSGSDSRINISIQNKIYGEVKLNPRQASRVGLPSTIQTSPICKSRTIIRDGKLNCSNMDLIVDLETCLTLTRYNVPFTRIDYKTTHPGVCINIDLSKFQLIDQKVGSISLDEIHDNVKSINVLKAKQRVLNALIKDYKVTTGTISGFTKEQTEILYDHGLDCNLQYIGVSNKIKETVETYTGDVVSFKVQGSSMSTFTKVLERVKEGKNLNELDTIQFNYYNEVQEKLNIFKRNEDILFTLNNELSSIKTQLSGLKMKNVLIKMLMVHSPISEMAFDTTQPVQYKGLTIEMSQGTFTR